MLSFRSFFLFALTATLVFCTTTPASELHDMSLDSVDAATEMAARIGASALDSDSTKTAAKPVRYYSPRTAFTLSLVIPGGGEFYLGNWSRAAQAIATDVILFEALRRSDSTAGTIALFIGSVHVVQGLFAAYEARIRNERSKAKATARSSPVRLLMPFTGPDSPALTANGYTGIYRIGISVPLR